MEERKKDEWQWEPNREEFEHAGLRCLLLRDKLLYLCGYVALPDGHPHYGKHFRDINVKVHQGLTFSGQGDGVHREKGYWWVGFCCERPGDYVPGLPFPTKGGEVYRNIDYVRAEVKKLAQQLQTLP